MYYICEDDKPKYWIEKFNIVKLQGNRIILPIKEKYKSKEKKIKTEQELYKKTKKIIDKANSKKVILSKKVQNLKTYVNNIQSLELDIVNGKWLFFMVIPEVLEYIIQKEKIKKQDTDIHILINDVNDNTIKLIKIVSKTYKNVYIVTKHIEKFKRIEEQILEENGTIIMIMNNKKKSLAKAKIIVNIDFPQELINQYIIYEQAIIVDCYGNITINKKRFNGLIIQNYDIDIKDKNKYYLENEKYFTKELYEAEFYKKQPYENVREKIQKDGINISKLFGVNKTKKKVLILIVTVHSYFFLYGYEL